MNATKCRCCYGTGAHGATGRADELLEGMEYCHCPAGERKAESEGFVSACQECGKAPCTCPNPDDLYDRWRDRPEARDAEDVAAEAEWRSDCGGDR